MQPESSDGLASVGTILPEEKAAFYWAAFSVFGIQLQSSPAASSLIETSPAFSADLRPEMETVA